MIAKRQVNLALLKADPAKGLIQKRVVELLSSESAVPSFSNAAVKLTALLQKEDVSLAQLAVVLSLDPGLATRCIRAAQSAAHGGHDITSIQDALFIIGMNEVRRIGLTVGVMNNFAHLKVKVDWDRFWLHSVLVGRLTERLAGSFRETNGLDYLAGLLHDVGKLILQHYFAPEFEQVVLKAMEHKCGHALAEKAVLGLDHAQVGAAICDVLGLPPAIVNGILNHHHPLEDIQVSDTQADDVFLSCCINLADAMANVCQVNIAGHKPSVGYFENRPEWIYLQENFNCLGLKLDLQEEIDFANSDIAALN